MSVSAAPRSSTGRRRPGQDGGGVDRIKLCARGRVEQPNITSQTATATRKTAWGVSGRQGKAGMGRAREAAGLSERIRRRERRLEAECARHRPAGRVDAALIRARPASMLLQSAQRAKDRPNLPGPPSKRWGMEAAACCRLRVHSSVVVARPLAHQINSPHRIDRTIHALYRHCTELCRCGCKWRRNDGQRALSCWAVSGLRRAAALHPACYQPRPKPRRQ